MATSNGSAASRLTTTLSKCPSTMLSGSSNPAASWACCSPAHHTRKQNRAGAFCVPSRSAGCQTSARLYLARLNGAFGGIFSHESWTLGQAYYFGNIDGQPPARTAQVYGHTLDQLDDLDATAIARPAGPRRGAEGAASNDPGSDARDDSELIRRVITGEGYHPEMCALAARYIGTGMKPDAVAEVLRGMMMSMPESARDDRWRHRFGQIPDLITSASAKFTDQAEARRAIARTTHNARRARLPSTDIKAAVLAEAERVGLDTNTALHIARRILTEEATSHAA